MHGCPMYTIKCPWSAYITLQKFIHFKISQSVTDASVYFNFRYYYSMFSFEGSSNFWNRTRAWCMNRIVANAFIRVSVLIF